jgi:hypothetical protein
MSKGKRNKLDALPDFILKPHVGWAGYAATLDGLRKFSRQITVSIVSSQPKQYKFIICNEAGVITCSLLLTVIKGSVLTHIWNKYARIDDEYQLAVETFTNDDGLVNTALWQVFGIDGMNNRIVSWEINWYEIKRFQRLIGMENIGITVFIRFMSMFVISAPACLFDSLLINPMPATHMFVTHLASTTTL